MKTGSICYLQVTAILVCFLVIFNSCGSDEKTVDPVYACNDGIDNDGDGKIDSADPGCENDIDDSEVDPSPFTQAPVFEIVKSRALNTGDFGQWDTQSIPWASIVVDGDTLHMWYSGSSGAPFYGGNKIGYAWSINGIDWAKHPLNPVMVPTLSWENNNLHGLAVIKDNAIFKMWYSTSNYSDFGSIGYATSTDGINWTKHSTPVIQAGSPGTWDDGGLLVYDVMVENNQYKMWFGGISSFNEPGTLRKIVMGFAESDDGVNWIKYVDPILDIGSSGSFDDDAEIYGASVLRSDRCVDCYEMFYSGASNSGPFIDYFSYATKLNDANWVKWKDYPLIEGMLSLKVMKYDGFYHLWYGNNLGSGGEWDLLGMSSAMLVRPYLEQGQRYKN